jgi:hypothetical protein
MTKELELFNRWIGEAEEVFSSGDMVFIERYLPLISIVKDAGFNFYKKHLEELIKNELFVSLNIDDAEYGEVEIIYNIPPEHHPEWEQYVKEMQHKDLVGAYKEANQDTAREFELKEWD